MTLGNTSLTLELPVSSTGYGSAGSVFTSLLDLCFLTSWGVELPNGRGGAHSLDLISVYTSDSPTVGPWSSGEALSSSRPQVSFSTI